MEKYVINGGVKLSGSVKVESAKNAVLPMLAAACLTDEEVVIENCPKIKDVLSMTEILSSIGVKTRFESGAIIIKADSINSCLVSEELSKKMRSSVYMAGALLSRLNKSKVFLPGGCDIGERPINIHLDGFRKMGAKCVMDGGGILCETKGLTGNKIMLNYPSVGATENLMIVASRAKGKTEILNAAKEPEVVDLMRFLNSMGAKIYGAGTSTILVEGVAKLHGTKFKPISDRIETGTFLVATAITGGEVEIKGCLAKNISFLVHKLCENACNIRLKNDIIYIKCGGKRKAFNLVTAPHPGFPTDMQAQALALTTVSEGVSVITETVFEKRFNYVNELVKMGAQVSVKGKTATVRGVKTLHGENVCASDLRGGAALVLAGLAAEGQTVVCGGEHVNRGYLDFDKKLRSLGADVKFLDGFNL